MIAQKELNHLAHLARVSLSPHEEESFLKEFDSILNYVDRLKEVDVRIDVEGRVGAVRDIVREDEVCMTTPEDRARLLDEVPHREGDFVAVQKIIAQD